MSCSGVSYFSIFILLFSSSFTFLLLCTFSILQIISNGCAYPVDGDVYFSVDSYPNYGRLSGRKLEDNRAGERVAVDTRKKNPADFALWKVRTFISFQKMVSGELLAS